VGSRFVALSEVDLERQGRSVELARKAVDDGEPGHISTQLNSHVSLLKFCQFTFGLNALTDRDAASHGMTDCIDTSQQPNAHP
jgi:hypothetical protein